MRQGLAVVFDQLDQPVIQTALAGGGIGSDTLIPLATAANEHATDRVARLLGQLQPALAHHDAIIYADSLTRIVLTHALARQDAIDRVVTVAMVYLGLR